MPRQRYENYWKITLAYTDIYSDEFNKSLSIIVNFIDENYTTPYSEKKYLELQEKITHVFPLNEASIRKVINTYIKLGFVNPRLESYHKSSLAFLHERNKERKKTIFSKIVYDNSSFDRSVTTDSRNKEINFLIKTLTEVKTLDKEDILALMTTNISSFPKGFLNREELDRARRYVESIDFKSRKYNQVGYLWSVLSKLDNLVIDHGNLYLEEDAIILGPGGKITGKKRDSYLQIIFKNELKEESMQLFGRIQCMADGLDYPPISFVASHIKPFVECSETEAYDVNNGLLLSRNIDILFDQGYISFEKNGEILVSNRLSSEVKKYLSNFSLRESVLNEKRKNYLAYHKEKIFN